MRDPNRDRVAEGAAQSMLGEQVSNAHMTSKAQAYNSSTTKALTERQKYPEKLLGLAGLMVYSNEGRCLEVTSNITPYSWAHTCT